MRIFSGRLIFISLFLLPSVVSGDARLTKVSLTYWNGDSLGAVVEFTEPPSRTSSFLLTDHDRLVIDFRNAVNNLSRKKIETKSGTFLRSIRSSQFTPLPNPITRLVFDLDNPVRYDISNTGKVINILLFQNRRRNIPSYSSPPAKVEKIEESTQSTFSKTEDIVKDLADSESRQGRIDLSFNETRLIDILNGLAMLAQSEVIYRACRPDTLLVSGEFRADHLGEILDKLLSSRDLSWSFSEDSILIIAGPSWSE